MTSRPPYQAVPFLACNSQQAGPTTAAGGAKSSSTEQILATLLRLTLGSSALGGGVDQDLPAAPAQLTQLAQANPPLFQVCTLCACVCRPFSLHFLFIGDEGVPLQAQLLLLRSILCPAKHCHGAQPLGLGYLFFYRSLTDRPEVNCP
eukprot:1157322-Pelagomonas_calceolata.AAC.2